MCGCDESREPAPVSGGAKVHNDIPYALRDGSVKFNWTPPQIAGYEPDPEEPTLLVPTYKSCLDRKTIVALQRNGQYTIKNRCKSERSEHFKKEVTREICESCPVRRCCRDKTVDL